MDNRQTASVKVREIITPDIPPCVALDHLHCSGPNGKMFVLTEEDIAAVKSVLRRQPDGRYGKKHELKKLGIHIPHSIIKYGHLYFAIYHGSYLEDISDIKYAQNLTTGNWFVIKIMRDKPSDENENEYQHTSRAGLARFAFSRFSDSKKQNQYIMLMRYLPGVELTEFVNFDFSQKKRYISFYRRLKLAIAAGSVIHDFHVKTHHLHRDIKGENFIYNYANDEVTLIDFGFCIPQAEDHSEVRGRIRGTSYTMAPEVWKGYFSEKTEVYAFGITLADIFGWLDPEFSKLIALDSNQYVNHATTRNENTRRKLYLYIRDQMLNRLPGNRPHMTEVVAFLNNLLKAWPHKTITAGILDLHEYKQSSLEQRAKIEKALKNLDYVYLIDRHDHHHSVTEYIALRRSMEKMGILTSTRIFIGNDPYAVAERLKLLVEDSATSSPTQWFYVTASKITASNLNILQSNHIHLLTNEYERSHEFKKLIEIYDTVSLLNQRGLKCKAYNSDSVFFGSASSKRCLHSLHDLKTTNTGESSLTKK